MPIQPLSSYIPRFIVSLFITYFESINISSCWNGGVALMAVIIAMISPIWFNCIFLGTFIAWFLSLSRLNHTLLPLCTSSLLLLKQALLVKIFTIGYLSCVLGFWSHLAGLLDILSGFVKILKHSARLFLHVIVELNRIASLFFFAIMFWSFLVLASDRFLWWYPW
jgi:hypothetical protein